MSDWLTRFESSLITFAEASALPHRVRVAWAKHQYEAIFAGFSQYFFSRCPLAMEAIRIADKFLTEGTYDLARIDSLIRADSSVQIAISLQKEGYPMDALQAVDMLMGCVASPFAVEQNQTMELATTSVLEPLVSCLGMTFASMQFWRQGVAAFELDSDDDYHDELQFPFYQFSRAGYEIAKQTSESEVSSQTFSKIQLDWTIFDPLPDSNKQARTRKPPIHER